jgi:hypothetical protein
MYTMGDDSVEIPPPTPELMEEMGKFIGEATEKGKLVATGGLAPIAMAKKISIHDGVVTVIDGPFTEAKELIGGWALMDCDDEAEALDWASRFLQIVGEGESTIRQVFGPE